ncbi:right-handed parallel beta-helix repeat-containing protein [Paenibacillus apii]|uniref:right-handed parallel beta-helix repeat-containing protein n=1 Tax=Paenibacillus apii TaxID=1850370 RepID=UPI001439D6EE|nr:right-handed parallel beta-helix repeat-containing protein [Paenibacillus apii]NJJ38540.1 right-handed parallel beta-helix repeat-containing protein [Paenibacillus apii]
MVYVDNSQITPLYANTAPGTTADASVVDPAIAALVTAINTNADLFTNFIGAITGTPGELGIPDQSIVERHLRNLAVTNPKLAPLAVTADKIANGTITTAKLADLLVTASKIADGTITEPKYGTGSVSSRAIANYAVDATKMNPALFEHITDIATNARFGQIDAQLADITLNLDSRDIVPRMFGALGNGAADDTAPLKDTITYAESLIKSLALKWGASSVGNVTIDLGGREYLISDTLIFAEVEAISNLRVVNGLIKVADDFATTDPVVSNFMVRVGNASGLATGIKFENVIFDGDQRAYGVYCKSTLNPVFDKCNFANVVGGIAMDDSSHEVTVTVCNFSNITPDFYGEYGIKAAYDCIVQANIITGFEVGILVTGNGNFITNANHMYSIAPNGYGIKTEGTAQLNTIVENYLDGCPILLGNNGVFSTVMENTFFNIPTYAAIFIKNSGSNYLSNCSITDNTFSFDASLVPAINGVAGTISGGILTISTGIFTPGIVGAVTTPSDNSKRFQVSGFIDSNNVYIKKLNDFADGAISVYLRPCDVCIWEHGNEFTTVTGGFIVKGNRVYNGESNQLGSLNGMLHRYYNPYPQPQTPIEIINTTHVSNSTADQVINFAAMPRAFIVWATMATADGNVSIGFGTVSPQAYTLPTAYRSLFTNAGTFTSTSSGFIRLNTPTGYVIGTIKSVVNNVLTIGWATTATAAETINLTILAL